MDSPTSIATTGGGTSGGSNTGTDYVPVGSVYFSDSGDPLAGYSWHLHNIAQQSFSSSAGISGEDMNVKEAHDLGFTGQGVKIAISDTGVETTHPDLNANQLTGQHRDYSQAAAAAWRAVTADPYPIEDEGHGTAVAGIASAVGWNNIGSRGIAPNAEFGAFLFVGNFHTTVASYEAKFLDQLDGAFDIFNYSYGYYGCAFIPTDSSVISAYQAGVTMLRGGKGAIYVRAAGNDYIGTNEDCDPLDTSAYLGNTNSSEDQNLPYLILTAAVNARGRISSYSTPGSGIWVSGLGGEFGTSSPAIIAPDITSCSDGDATSSYLTNFDKGVYTISPDCSYMNHMNGTSSAAPSVAGVIALMLEANPNLTWRDVKHILAVTADPIRYSTGPLSHPGTGLTGHVYDYLYTQNFAGYRFSNTFGFGRVNAEDAVGMAQSYSVDLGTYLETDWTDFVSGAVNLAIPDNSAVGASSVINVTTDYVIESIQIKLTTTHPYIGDLGVQLTSPSGTTSRILLVNSNIPELGGLSDFTLISNAFYGESSAGTWTLKVVDGKATDIGQLSSWKIKINGHTP